MSTTRCDLLCVCAHSDDAEIAIGGMLRLLADRDRRAWVCDLTRGELATNADPDTRWREARASSSVLGLTGRLQLALPDGFLTETDRAQVLSVVHVLRRLRPAWVVTAPAASRHPDHMATPALVKRAVFLSRLVRLEVAEPAMRCWMAAPDGALDDPPADSWVPAVVAGVCPEGEEPDLLFDVTASWDAKKRSLACYASQFHRTRGRRPTHINDRKFLADIEAIGRRWGRRAGVERAEALKLAMRPVLDDLPQWRWA